VISNFDNLCPDWWDGMGSAARVNHRSSVSAYRPVKNHDTIVPAEQNSAS